MSQENNHRTARPRRSSVAYEEEKAWIAFYRRVGDPAIATELMQHLDADPEMKRLHPALYLRCKQTLRNNKERQARAKRIGQFVRMLLGVLVLQPILAMRGMLRAGGDIAVECLPVTSGEPAVRQLKNLTKKSPFATAQNNFPGKKNAAQPTAEDGNGDSRNAHAA